MVEEANKSSESAAKAAKDAASDAQLAKTEAQNTLNQADKIRNYNFYAMIAAAVAILAVSVAFSTFLWNLSNRNEDLAGKVYSETKSLNDVVNKHIRDIDRYSSVPNEARASASALRGDVERQQVEIKKLSNQISELKAELDRVKMKPYNPNRNGN